jgi:hypothetical protein
MRGENDVSTEIDLEISLARMFPNIPASAQDAQDFQWPISE